ncbi:hypothetical protein P7C71_g550, partial [Lecanoromycetidae sp. Uapishka_2]
MASTMDYTMDDDEFFAQAFEAFKDIDLDPNEIMEDADPSLNTRLARPHGARRPGVTHSTLSPATGIQQQQSMPSPFGQIATINTNGSQQQQPAFGFPQQAQTLGGTQSQSSMSFPPFGSNSNGSVNTNGKRPLGSDSSGSVNANANSSFPPPTSGFNFTSEKAQYITNPFSPTADPLQDRNKGFQGTIFRTFGPPQSKEAKKKRDQEGQQALRFASPHESEKETNADPHKSKKTATADRKRKWFEEGEKAPQFAAHSPFHNDQANRSTNNGFAQTNPQSQVPPYNPFGQDMSNLQTLQSAQPHQPASSTFGTASNSFGQLAQAQQSASSAFGTASNLFGQAQSNSASDVFANLGQSQNQVPPSKPFGQDMSISQPLKSAQPSSSVFGNLTTQKHFASDFFSQPPTSGSAFVQAPSGSQQAQASITGPTGDPTPQAPNQVPATAFGQNAPTFGQPQSAQPTSNLFAQLGTPQPSSTVFGQGAASTSHGQLPETTASPTDQTMMSASPDQSSQPFQAFSQPKTQQPSAPGGSLFERISQPQELSTESVAPAKGASLFSRVTFEKPAASSTAPTPTTGVSLFDRATFNKPAESSTETATPTTEGNLFERASFDKPAKPSTETAASTTAGHLLDRVSFDKPAEPSAETTASSKEGNLFDRASPSEPEVLSPDTAAITKERVNLFDKASFNKPAETSTETATPTKGGSLFDRVTFEKPDTTASARPSPSSTKPTEIAFSGFKTQQTPQASPSIFAPSEKSGLVPSISDSSAKDQAVTQSIPPTAQKTSNSIASQRANGECPPAPSEFTENEKRDLTTGWRLKALEVGMHYQLRNNPTNGERIKKFYMYSKKKILDANGGPLQSPNAQGKRKMGDSNEGTSGKKARSDPRGPLEGPSPGQRRKSADANDDDEDDNSEVTVKKARLNTPRQPLQGPDPGGKRNSPDAEEETNGKKLRFDIPGMPAGPRPHPSLKRKSTDEEEDETDTQGKRARLKAPSLASPASQSDVQGKKTRQESSSGTAPTSQTASLFQNIMGGKNGTINTSGHTHQDDHENDDESPSRDHTWKPESPITFGMTSPSQKPAFGGLFGVSKPITKSPNASLGFAFTPTNASSTILAPPSNPELTAMSYATSTSASNGEPLKDSSVTAKTLPKPTFNLFTSTPTESAKVNPGLTPAFTASKSLAPPSNTESPTTSRATSPGATTGESANESNADEEDNTSKDTQVDLAAGGPGEEDEDVLFEVKVKAMVYNAEKKQWPIKGLGPLRILRHKESGKTRMLMRQEPSGKILLNCALEKQLKYQSTVDKSCNVPVINAEGKIETWALRTGHDDAAKKIASLLEEHKSA